MHFTSVRWDPQDDRPFSKYLTTGMVEIRGIKKEIPFQVQFEPNTYGGKDELRAQVSSVLNRFDFDICPSWPDLTIGKNVKVQMEIVCDRVP